MARTKTFDEAHVTAQAQQTFHDHGYAATSIEQLTASTGLSRSSIYGTFGDKHGLFLRSFSRYCDENADVIERGLDGDADGAMRRLEQHLRDKINPRESVRGCLLAKATAELAGEDAEVVRTATDFYGRYERALTTCVAGAQTAGDIRADLDAAAIGNMLLAVLRGIETLGRAGQSREVLESSVEATLTMLRA